MLEDRQVLADLQAALRRGIRVRAIVDREKYAAFQAEQDHLATYLTGAGGELHLSSPIFRAAFQS